VFAARSLPASVARLFLDVCESLEVLQYDTRIADAAVCEAAIGVRRFTQALRAAERLVGAREPFAPQLGRAHSPSAALGDWDAVPARRLEALRGLSRFAERAAESVHIPKFQAVAQWHLRDVQAFANAAVHLDPADTETFPYRIPFQLVTGQYAGAEALIAEFRDGIIDTRGFGEAQLVFDIAEVVGWSCRRRTWPRGRG
jgi:hypothetical protein